MGHTQGRGQRRCEAIGERTQASPGGKALWFHRAGGCAVLLRASAVSCREVRRVPRARHDILSQNSNAVSTCSGHW